jgi:hypothetical protein
MVHCSSDSGACKLRRGHAMGTQPNRPWEPIEARWLTGK